MESIRRGRREKEQSATSLRRSDSLQENSSLNSRYQTAKRSAGRVVLARKHAKNTRNLEREFSLGGFSGDRNCADYVLSHVPTYHDWRVAERSRGAPRSASPELALSHEHDDIPRKYLFIAPGDRSRTERSRTYRYRTSLAVRPAASFIPRNARTESEDNKIESLFIDERDLAMLTMQLADSKVDRWIDLIELKAPTEYVFYFNRHRAPSLLAVSLFNHGNSITAKACESNRPAEERGNEISNELR